MQKRARKIVYHDKQSDLKDLLQKDKSVSIQMNNLQYLAAEIYRVKMVSLQK